MAAKRITGTSTRRCREAGLRAPARCCGDLMIFVPEESQARKQVVRKAATERAIVVDPAIRLYYVEVEPPTLEHQFGDWDRIAAELAPRFGLPGRAAGPGAAQRAADDRAQGRLEGDGHRLAGTGGGARQPGYCEEAFGLAVDIGTTTVAMHLCDLRTGAVLATASQMNPQVAYGEDLMSRVSYCDCTAQPGWRRCTARSSPRSTSWPRRPRPRRASPSDAITDIVLVGNSVMHHILLNIPPRELGQSPFGPAISDAVDIKARDLGLKLAPGAQAHVLPVEAGTSARTTWA